MSMDLTGKVIIVTGASSGTGRATAVLAAERGARVVPVGRDESRLSEVGAQIAGAGGEAHPVSADLAADGAPASVVEQAVSRFGRIDGIVHAAGIYREKPFPEAPVELLDSQWALHVRAPYLLTQSALPHLSDGAAVVFVASTVARSGFVHCAAYTATKGGVEAMARSLAAELAPAVRVNIVMPGFIDTPMISPACEAWPELPAEIVRRTPAGFIGAPEDIAQTILFLCADESRYVIGSTLVADGGWTAQAWQS